MGQKPTWTDKQEKALGKVIAAYQGQPGALIPVLQKAQEIIGYLPLEVMERISQTLRIPPAQVFGVATFYAQFSFKPRGRHTILSCQGTACHVRGGAKVLDEVLRTLDLKEGGTTEDGLFTVEKVYCIGCCSLAPAIVIDDTAYGRLTPDKAKKIVGRYS